MKVEYLTENDPRWDLYVKEHPWGTIYHTIAWKNIVENHFNKKTRYVYVENKDEIRAVLPLVVFKSKIFGAFIVSFPYVNYGGMLYSCEQSKNLLLEQAKQFLAVNLSEFIEFRTYQADAFDLPVKTSKVTYYLSLPSDEDSLMKQFKSKLRSQIRRPIKEGMYSKVLGAEGLAAFYDIFAKKMRDLGTPVYSKLFFQTILDELPDHSNIMLVYTQQHIPVAAAFLINYKGMMEIPWAATLREYDRLSPNMLLYYDVLKYAISRKCHVFDFGRCTKDSGTYRFKKQWGGEEKTLYWYYLLNQGQSMPQVNPNNPKYDLAIKIWQKLPVTVTKLIGPSLVKHIP